MKLKIIEHYFMDDEDCEGDYAWVEVFDVDKKILMQTYGDYYHDHGDDKAEAFVDGVRYMAGESVKVKYESIADSED